MSFKHLAIGLIAAAVTVPAQAATTIAATYTRISPVEKITALFNSPTGATSTGVYAGPVEVLVSGTGFSAGSRINDAFYFPDDQTPLAGSYYHLGLSKFVTSLTMPPTQVIESFISFIDNVGAVSPGTIPAFAADSTYHFVVNAGTPATTLTLGVLDGVFADNGGQYNISLWQLAPGVAAVPESATWMMMIVGFGVVGGTMRRRRPVLANA